MKSCIFLAGLFFAAIINTACVSAISNTRLTISIDNVDQSKILPLKNSNDDITLYNIGTDVMEKSGFMNQNEQEYGYYAIAISSRTDKAPNFVICVLGSIPLFIPSLIGFPTDFEKFDITTNFYIFDSTGTLIKVYVNSNSFTKLAGLYYGQDPNKKASKYYSLLFKGILEQANTQSDEINYFLREAGPITNENMQGARMKITEFFRLNKR